MGFTLAKLLTSNKSLGLAKLLTSDKRWVLENGARRPRSTMICKANHSPLQRGGGSRATARCGGGAAIIL